MSEPKVVERDYTVVGMWWESAERWLGQYTAGSPEMAEDMAHAEAQARGLHLAVCGVFEGRLANVDHHVFVDPSASSQEEMDQLRREASYDEAPDGA